VRAFPLSFFPARCAFALPDAQFEAKINAPDKMALKMNRQGAKTSRSARYDYHPE
jgi:hypothetical protein